ncbi:MAG TPA: hypothetical protein DDW27_09685 [Bacteroidales bacterium]|nr:hypothetical protein [Bacteroidales bacterium]
MILFIFLPSSVTGINPYHLPVGPAEAGRGSVCIMKPGFWSSFRNQSLISSYPSLSAGVNYQNRFNINELGTRAAALIIPVGRTSLGIFYSHFGFSHFSRETGGVACGLRLSEKISAGIQIDYFHEKTSGEYGNNRSVTFEGGLLITPSGNITVGIHLFNPVPNSLRGSILPSTVTAGAGIELADGLFAGIEAEMSTCTTLLLRTGFEYEPAQNLKLRGGFCSENTSFTFGLGYHFRSIDLDMSFATHQKLGITTSVSMIFILRKTD